MTKYYHGEKVPKVDSTGDVIAIKGDNICDRYEIIKEIGRGAFSKVFKVNDHKYNRDMAIKIVKAKSVYMETGIHECEILININKWILEDKIISLSDLDLNSESEFVPLLLFKYFDYKKHICMVFRIYDIDLYYLYKNKNINYKEIVSITKDIFLAVKFLKKHQIVHGDLKPENIMITDKKRAVIIDYGLAFYENDNYFNDYIQSRYYRAPEVYFNMPVKHPIDVWSIGCILYEIYNKKPLFRGKNKTEMIVAYISCLGMPFSDYINKVIKSTNNKIDLYNYQYKRIPNNLYIYNNKLIDNQENELINSLIRKCVTYNSDMRLTPEKALEHDLF
jgi:serine/threonine protein kinase